MIAWVQSRGEAVIGPQFARDFVIAHSQLVLTTTLQRSTCSQLNTSLREHGMEVGGRYPRPFEGLTGWTIKDIACGAQHYAVSAEYMGEHSAITW